ncbi:HAMP domain-containing sensor histidine kinase [Nocardioides litoris]|uniref:HAMP domain-containing sensor histidine kinase n=1 Tax=Nocardioides litoris TaxID=1926648 RepID=UPI0011235E3E|nr:HAMP domain-containing sensor histidine kinase [Nocardioides litoris]
MRRRLLALALVLLAALLTSLAVPLLTGWAEGRTTALHADRLAAATRFATLAAAGFDEGGPAGLEPDLERYDEVYGARVWVVDADGTVVAGSAPAAADDLDAAVATALDGTPTAPPPAAWPWRTERMVVATPVGRDAQVLGAVVLVQDTGVVRDAVARRTAWVAALGLLVLGLVGWLVAIPLVGWITRPVRRLEDSAGRLADGDASVRVDTVGPPELRRLGAAFNTMAERVELSQRQQRDLVSDVSHQLANPLTALRLRLDNLAVAAAAEGRGAGGPDDPFDLGPVLAETDRMSRALEGLVEVSRAGGSDRTPVPVDVVTRLGERVQLWRPLFGDLLALEVEPTTAPAVLEEDLVPTVVDALLDNAGKYAEGAAVTVRLAADGHDHGAWLLEVRDAGPGVDAAEAAALGERFRRLDRHADVEGTGLGLAIVVARVRDAGGRVEIAPGDPGLRVRVRLPAAAATGPAPGTSAPTPGAGPAAR